MRLLGRILLGFFATIGVLVVLLVAAGIGFAVWARGSPQGIADGTVLSLDIGSGFPDAAQSNPIERLLFPGRPDLREVLDAIERAGDDPRVKGLVARVGNGELPTAEAQELRQAISAFRDKGKRAIAYADSFGELASGTRSYYLATAFDEIWVQPHGILGLVGLRAEEPFFRGTLDLIGVTPRFDAREQYKSAADPLTKTSMTGPDREQIQALLDSIYGQIVAGIAAARGLDPAAVRALVDRGPQLAQEALAAHLIDHIGYSDEAFAELGAGPAAARRPLPLSRYLDAAGPPHRSGPTIALIYATGLITQGGGDDGGLVGNEASGADRIIRAFRMAERDKDVRAILFRIDSPGGSAVASESIWRETVRAEAQGKKVIVSMGNVAGSGGYYIAANADKIVAEPATLTGSIGVLAGKLLLNGLIGKIGASTSAVEVGADAGIASPFQDFTPQGYQRFEAFLDDVYAAFKSRVAEGRKMDPATVESIAKGRIWSGADAKAKGLVDVLGGFETALQVAKQEAGIPAASDVTLKEFPPPETTERLIARLLGRATGSDGAASAIAQALAPLRPLAAAVERLAAPPGALVMAPVEIR